MNTENINLKDFLTTLQRNPSQPDELFVSIKFDSYKEIGDTIQSIANACINCLSAKENDMLYKENFFDFIRLLEIQIQLIPHTEFELLDNLNK